MRVALIQYKGDKERWLEHQRSLTSAIRRALLKGARLVVTPEMACTGYLFQDEREAGAFAERPGSPWAVELCSLAQQHQAHLIVGVIERNASGLYNSAWHISSNGALTSYHKRLLYCEDERWAQSGAEARYKGLKYPVFEVEGRRATLAICMDLNDDEFIEHCHEQQPELIAFPTNWVDQGEEVSPYWAWRLQGLKCHLLAANTYGSEAQVQFRGESAVLLSEPPTLLALAPKEGDLLIELDLPHPREVSQPSGA